MTGPGVRADASRSLRARVISTALGMNEAGVNRGKSGNVSVRWREPDFDGFLITPTGMPYGDLAPDDIVAVALGGETRGRRAPSSEWRFHRDIYGARDDVDAIVHAHAPFCTALACHSRTIPPFHYMVAVAGGPDIRCAPYATFGSQALADAALKQGLPLAIVGDPAYLPPNGLLSFGPTRLQYARITARYVDAILRGANPAGLPVEQPAKFDLAISLRTAKALGLAIPQTLLVRADEVIQ